MARAFVARALLAAAARRLVAEGVPIAPAGAGAAAIVRSEPAASRQREASLAALRADSSQLDASAPPIPDETRGEVNTQCGPPSMVTTCGFPSSTPACWMGVNGTEVCIRGVCVCTSGGNCLSPSCRDDPSGGMGGCAQQGLAACTTGAGKPGCITSAGVGWQCWHPCNYNHMVSDYGVENNFIVAYIRDHTPTCLPYKVSPLLAGAGAPPPSSALTPAPEEPGMDTGIKLSYPSFPIFGSTVIVGQEPK